MLRTSLRRGRGRLQILTAQVADGTRPDQRDLVQPAVAAGEAEAGHARAPARRAEPVRLRRPLVRPQRRLGDGRLRAGLPGERGDLGGEAARARRGGAAARDATTPTRCRRSLKAERGLPLRGDALASIHRPRSLDEAEEGRQRLAFDELLVLQLGARAAHGRARGAGRGRAARAGRADRALPRRAAVRADRAPGGGDRRDRRRPRAHDADAAAAAGRRRLRARRSSRSTRSCARSRPAARAR